MTGNFFAVGRAQFIQACRLGMNPAAAFLVMARGTLADNSTTSWSALAIHNHSGIARRRAKTAIETLTGDGIVEVISRGAKPKYKLAKPESNENLVWLPNTLVDGAGREIPPVMKLREYGSLEILKKFILLYAEQDLEADGGLPRTIARLECEREKIGNIGPFTLYGFRQNTWRAYPSGLLEEFKGQEDSVGNRGAWTVLAPLKELGLLEESLYLAESCDREAELIYPVVPATQDAMENVWVWAEQMDRFDFLDRRGEFQYFGIALRHIPNACLTGCLRLHYRPHTSKTSRWWAVEQSKIQAMVGLIHHSCKLTASPQCAHQG